MTSKRASKPKAPETTTPSGGAASAVETVVAVAIQAHVPVFLHSEPGMGKSAVIGAIAKQLPMTLYTLMLGVREPTDQGGLPAVFTGPEGQPLVRLIPPGWARDIIRNDGGLVFLDEITSATPAVMNSALRLVQEGVVGDCEYLPRETSFVLAGNPTDTNVGANELTAGIANRCLHVRWPFDYKRWRAGMLRRWAPEARSFPKLAPGWKDGIEEMAALVVAFLDTASTLAQAQPRNIEEQGRPWPSGRTWELTATMLAAAKSAGYGPKSDVARLIVLGLVGEAAQVAWSSWIASQDLPSTRSVLDDPERFKLPTRHDQVLAILSGVVAYVEQDRNNLDTYMRAWSVVIRVLNQDPSLAINAAKSLAALMPPGADAQTKSPFHRGLTLMKDHLRKSGVDYGRAS